MRKCLLKVFISFLAKIVVHWAGNGGPVDLNTAYSGFQRLVQQLVQWGFVACRLCHSHAPLEEAACAGQRNAETLQEPCQWQLSHQASRDRMQINDLRKSLSGRRDATACSLQRSKSLGGRFA